MQTCVDCGEAKHLDAFRTYPSGRPYKHCKPCHTQRNREWKATNPDRVRVNAVAYRDRNRESIRARGRAYTQRPEVRARIAAKRPERADYHREYNRTYRQGAYRWRLIERKYGITQADYEAIAAQQLGACAICRRSLDDVRVHIDHDHASGIVRGLLCQRCNQSIGLLGDNSENARRAALYLDGRS